VSIKFKGIGAKFIETGRHHPSEKITKLKNGCLIYEVKVNGIEEIRRWIFGFGEDAKVPGSKDLKEKIKLPVEK